MARFVFCARPGRAAGRMSALIAITLGPLMLAPVRAADWVQLKTPYFTLVSEASEGRTRDWAIEFELFRRGMMLFMPIDPGAIEPVTLVLFRSDSRLRPFKPLENGKPAKVAAYFTRRPGSNMIALSIEGARDDVREVIFHEAVHWHLAAANRPRPRWLEEGLAEVFGNFRLSGNAFIVGANRPESIRYVKLAKPVPFAKIMAIDALSYNGKHGDETALFYHQSWAMVHALIFGTEGVGYQALAQYLALPPLDRDLAKDLELGLGLTPAVMDQKTAKYVDQGRFTTLKFPFDRSAVEKGFNLQPAPAGESDLTLGNLLLAADQAKEAEAYLWRAYTALPGDARCSEALAMLALALERPEEAVAKFKEAIERGGGGFLAHFFLGQIELNSAQRFSFGPPDVSAAIPLLVKSVQLNRHFIPGYEALAEAVRFLPHRLVDVEVLLAQGLARSPGNMKLEAALRMMRSKPVQLAPLRLAP